MWLLVDGIYPEISRFVKTIQEPIGKNLSNYAKWQESSRKSVEQAFGVLQRKFHIIVKANEHWYVDDIANIVVSTIVLHNMMVCHRVSSDENEDISFYECVLEEDDGSIIVNNNHNNDNSNNHNNNQQDLGCEEEYINRRQAELDLHRRLELEALDGAPSIVPLFTQQKRIRQLNSFCLMYAQRRWETLYNASEHNRLRQAIISQLEINNRYNASNDLSQENS